MALKLGIQTYQILTNDDEVCIPSLSSILLAVLRVVPAYLKICPAAGPVQLSNTSIVPSLVPGLAATAPLALGAQRLLCTVATTTYNMLVGSNNYCVVRQTTNVTAYAIWRHALWRTCPSSPLHFFLSNLTHAGKSIKKKSRNLIIFHPIN